MCDNDDLRGRSKATSHTCLEGCANTLLRKIQYKCRNFLVLCVKTVPSRIMVFDSLKATFQRRFWKTL